MRHPSFPGVGKRIRDRLLALGYVREDKEPDVGRFLREKGYDGRYFYPWLKDRTPSPDFLERLAADLQCTRAWLLLGEGPAPDGPKPRRRGPVSIAGGSANDAPPPVAEPQGPSGGIMFHWINAIRYRWWPEPLPRTMYAYA